jgi:uncharacterized protein
MIEQAEKILRQYGVPECRVRLHAGGLARIEVPIGEVSRMTEPEVRQQLTTEFRRLGFEYITLDLEGFRSGSLNALHQLQLKTP